MKKHLFLFLLLIIISHVNAQQLKNQKHLSIMNTFDIPPIEAFKMPNFFKLLIEDEIINIKEIDDAFEEFEDEEKKTKVKKVFLLNQKKILMSAFMFYGEIK
jgi:hypothetical protein